MTKTKKFTAIFGTLVAVTAIAYFLVPQSHKDQLFIQPVETAGSDPASSLQPDSDQLGSMAKVASPHPTPQDPTDDYPPHSDTPQPFSSVLSEIVTQETLYSDIKAWEELMEEKGWTSVTDKGHKIYIAHSSRRDGQDPNLLKKYSKNTPLEEIVELAQKGDPSAMLALTKTAYSARRWAEGDYYALEAARISGSTEPILLAAQQRQKQAINPMLDRGAASWYLAAYLEGNLTAAGSVEAYFRFAEIEDQAWVVNRAQEIIAQIIRGG